MTSVSYMNTPMWTLAENITNQGYYWKEFVPTLFSNLGPSQSWEYFFRFKTIPSQLAGFLRGIGMVCDRTHLLDPSLGRVFKSGSVHPPGIRHSRTWFPSNPRKPDQFTSDQAPMLPSKSIRATHSASQPWGAGAHHSPA